MVRAGGALAALLPALASAPGAGAQAATTICVPERASTAVLSTNANGECPSKPIAKTTVRYKAEALPAAEELETLDRILPHMTVLESGVGGKPTIRFSGVNVQLVNGAGKTETVNGAGNLVIGYDENAGRSQTGSHDLILGEEQSFTSFGGLVAGYGNTVSGREATVTGGALNTASGFYSSVSGGMHNTTKIEAASIQGGRTNLVEGRFGSIFGGKELTARAEYEAIP